MQKDIPNKNDKSSSSEKNAQASFSPSKRRRLQKQKKKLELQEMGAGVVSEILKKKFKRSNKQAKVRLSSWKKKRAIRLARQPQESPPAIKEKPPLEESPPVIKEKPSLEEIPPVIKEKPSLEESPPNIKEKPSLEESSPNIKEKEPVVEKTLESSASQVDQQEQKSEQTFEKPQKESASLENNLADSKPSKKKKKTKSHSSLFALLLLLLAIFGGILFDSRSNSSEQSSETFSPEVETTQEIVVLKNKLPHRDFLNARKVALSFLNATSLADATSDVLSHDGGFKVHYQPMVRAEAQLKYIQGKLYRNGTKTALFRISSENTPSTEMFLIAKPKQPFSIDWQSIYLVKEGNSLLDLRSANLSPKVFKAYFTRSHIYDESHPEIQYQSLSIRDYSGQLEMVAYVKRGTLASALLAQAFMTSNLKLEDELASRVEASIVKINDGLEIVEIISSNWADLSTYLPKKSSK